MENISDFSNTLDDLFKTRHLKEMLEYLHKGELTGWEKWFQFELLKYLDGCNYESRKEEMFKRYEKNNRLDIIYRKPNTTTKYFVGVELKVDMWPEYSIKKLLHDMNRITAIEKDQKADQNKLKLRSVIGIAFYSKHKFDEKSSDLAKYKKFVNDIVENNPNMSRRKYVAGWECLLIGWECKNFTQSQEQYNKFIDKLEEITSKYEIKFRPDLR